MSDFRLGRLMCLRERQEKEEKSRWAATLRAVFDARKARAAGRETLVRAHRDLSSQEGASIHPGSRIAAEATLDHLSDRKLQQERAVADAELRAQEARVPYDQRRREAEALRRLEGRWKAARRKRRRRREDRDRQEHIARQCGKSL
ncbi:MAG: hypothetical protein ACPGPE_00050 [Planctomycetota bacterium]